MNGVIPAWLLLLAVLALVVPPMPTGHLLNDHGDELVTGCVWSPGLQGRTFDEAGQRVCKTDPLTVLPPLTGKSGTGSTAICAFVTGNAGARPGNVSPVQCSNFAAAPYVRY